jgi:hypothetical protein
MSIGTNRWNWLNWNWHFIVGSYFQISLWYSGPSWSWSYGSWIYNYLCNDCLSPITLRVLTPLRRGVLDTTLCDKDCQWLATGRWFSLISSTNKTEKLKYCWKWHQAPIITPEFSRDTACTKTITVSRQQCFFSWNHII